MYKWLWKRIGSRPWTYIIRESPRWAAAIGASLMVIGMVALRLPKPVVLIVGAVIGFVLGHIFW